MFHLNEKHSTPFVSNGANRHIHISMQIPGGDKYANRIIPVLEELNLKSAACKNALQAEAFATDTIWLYDGYLDDALRKVKGRCSEYDNEHTGSNTLYVVFPDGKITEIITENVLIEPSKAHQVSLNIASLGAEHELYPLAAELQTAVDNINAKITLREAASKVYEDAKTAMKIAKLAVVNQYNANYFAAANDVNKKYAERLFPKLPPPRKEDEETE